MQSLIEGELYIDKHHRIIYSTDASVYRKLPLGVVYPKSTEDLQRIVEFAGQHEISIIPRSAGTSLAGQCVGEGLVVDVSKYMTGIIEFNKEDESVIVEPGVIRDELNNYLKPFGYWFSPNTSTSNRCMIGGMVGNNSCGTTSIKYGTTRDKLIGAEIVLADGSVASIGDYSSSNDSVPFLDSVIQGVESLVNDDELAKAIKMASPKADIHRRNTGYDLESVLNKYESSGHIDLLKLIAGSEGTLCLTSKIKVKLDKLPPAKESVVCAHFDSMKQAMQATQIIMKFSPYACELMDRKILELARGNKAQAENSFFVEGKPEAILAIELRSENDAELGLIEAELINALRRANLGYAFPLVKPPETDAVWTLRAAGLGVLSNFPGDKKPVAFVEDTAVSLEDLPEYIADFEELMQRNGQESIYYAHAGAGELHLRPVLNLKTKEGQSDFRKIGEESAKLVKKFNGSLSGEHGDGIVRAEFIKYMVGEKVYDAFQKVKRLWDPKGIFNPGKIVEAYPMDKDFRYIEDQNPFDFETKYNWGEENMLQAAERCNGSGDCRKNAWTGATMCPSYQASKNEKDSTRARANMLRESLTRPTNPSFVFGSKEMVESLDLCLSCKACRKECPSSVDMAALKSEAMYQYQKRFGMSRRSKFFSRFDKLAAIGSKSPILANTLLNFDSLNKAFKSYYSIAEERSIPKFNSRRASKLKNPHRTKNPDFVLYIDEFTEFQDEHLAQTAISFFGKLGYKFELIYAPSGRAAISKSDLDHAEYCAKEVVQKLSPYLSNNLPIVGLEPSAILGFRDEFLKMKIDLDDKVSLLSKLSRTFEEFVFQEFEKGRIGPDHFTDQKGEVHIHMHCHQKALSHPKYSKVVLSLPVNYKSRLIPSGCCGMAGSFGYEKEHYDLSQEIGRLVLFPHVEDNPNVILALSGTSCRHQVLDATERKTHHPVEILNAVLK